MARVRRHSATRAGPVDRGDNILFIPPAGPVGRGSGFPAPGRTHLPG
jgi:hypothetical protein